MYLNLFIYKLLTGIEKKKQVNKQTSGNTYGNTFFVKVIVTLSLTNLAMQKPRLTSFF